MVAWSKNDGPGPVEDEDALADGQSAVVPDGEEDADRVGCPGTRRRFGYRRIP